MSAPAPRQAVVSQKMASWTGFRFVFEKHSIFGVGLGPNLQLIELQITLYHNVSVSAQFTSNLKA
ncbi:hypothetical protein DS901_06095 [Loktanella sp. D2R18]|uniref:hypothetical protein n=1 Tax=Rhodobacterales TaxID=204455 RepID=UPI000DE8BA81|nr:MULTISPECIES: hypothetical protein [Rhodobacterales]MDO6592073.1 hypothetical protein [Yoonia sp. 1_MG-2023]RBW44795.1 hypothetical protein DS901_06095 [Loktanella sp. D2R18]